MDFCIGTCAKIDRVGLVPLAEDLGVTHFGVGEGPLLFSDPYQYLALAATQTSTIRLGTMVTNPLTRIAPVTANSMATLNALRPAERSLVSARPTTPCARWAIVRRRSLSSLMPSRSHTS